MQRYLLLLIMMISGCALADQTTFSKESDIRTAIKNKNWDQVVYTINTLDPIEHQAESWQYWKARALEALDEPNHIKLYQRLANNRSYYGFLSSDRLRQPINLQHNPKKINVNAITALAKHPRIQHIKALYTLDRHREMIKEWKLFMTSLSRQEKSHAGQLAHQLQWHHLAIDTLNQSDNKNDLILRFPFAFKKLIVDHATTHALDPAWIFALARQESQFNSSAASKAGAVGLMQLMPTTAQSLSKKILDRTELHRPEMNIKLGTQYLKYLHTRANNPIIATASYNAGFTRVKKWLPDDPCEADIWIESIPYEETRNYVKNILTYTGIYTYLQGQPFTISSIMPKITRNS